MDAHVGAVWVKRVGNGGMGHKQGSFKWFGGLGGLL